MNVTVPVGTPAAGTTGLTVAVSVTIWPTAAGFGDNFKAVVVLPLLIVSVSAVEVLGATPVSPSYVAVIARAPTASPRVVSVARRAAFNGRVSSGVAPSKKVTVPVGVPAPGATTLTVAVNTTGRPITDGFGAAIRAVALAARVTVSVKTPRRCR
jgi:hypothetical protein